MSTARLADRQIREAATQAALRLDVRGPVSEALGRTGIVVAPEPLAEAVASPAPTVEVRAPAPSLRGVRPAERVVKPFEPAPWPTKRPVPAPSSTPLSGLTADERRVHRILLDSLARLNAERNGVGGLSYAERARLEALDLGYIDDQLATLTRRRKTTTTALQWGMTLSVLLFPLAAFVLIASGVRDAVPMLLGGLVAFGALGAAFAARSGVGSSASPRQAIYEALRELALVADPGDAASEALAQADLLIDHLADADESAHAEPRRLRVRT